MIKLTDTHVLEFFGYIREIMLSLHNIERKMEGVLYRNCDDMDERIEELITDKIDYLDRQISELRKFAQEKESSHDEKEGE
jgi:hypothetical protein